VSNQLDWMRSEIVDWARREPRQSAETARDLVLARIRDDRSFPGARLLAPATVALLLFVLTLIQPAPRGVSPRETRGEVVPAAEPSVGPMKVVYRLRSGATLYVVLPMASDVSRPQPTVGKDGKG
jgi:hypothetical protein